MNGRRTSVLSGGGSGGSGGVGGGGSSGGSEDPVVEIINAKVLQEFIPRVPEIVSFIETHYKMSTNQARDFLQGKMTKVLAALHTPLLTERRKRQNVIEALKEEVSFVRDEVVKRGDAANALKDDLARVTREKDRGKLAVADLEIRDGGHREHLRSLLRAFGSPAETSTPWEDVDDRVAELLDARKEHETLKKQHETLKKRLEAKTAEMVTSANDANKTAAERLARMSAELSEVREEFASYRTREEKKIAELQRSVREKSGTVKRLEQKNAASEKRIDSVSKSDAGKTVEIERLARSLSDSQATVARIKKELLAHELQLAGESNNHATMTTQYHAHIDELNEKVNDLSLKLGEAVKANETAKVRFDEYSAVKSLYERVSASLETARNHFSRHAVIDYNEPVTTILLDVLDKVRANDTDFSTLKLPSCTDAAVQTDDRSTPNLVDAQNQTTPEQRSVKTVHLVANSDDPLPPSALVWRPDDSIQTLLLDMDWSMNESVAKPSGFLEPVFTTTDIADPLTTAHESTDAKYSALVTAFEDDLMESFALDYSSSTSAAPVERLLTDAGEYSSTCTVPPALILSDGGEYSATAPPEPIVTDGADDCATAVPSDRIATDGAEDSATAVPSDRIGECSGTATVLPVTDTLSDGFETALRNAVREVETRRDAPDGRTGARRHVTKRTNGRERKSKRPDSAVEKQETGRRNVNDVDPESKRPFAARGNGPDSRKRLGVESAPDDSDSDYTPELKRSRKSRPEDLERNDDARDPGPTTGEQLKKVRHASSRDGGVKIKYAPYDIRGSKSVVPAALDGGKKISHDRRARWPLTDDPLSTDPHFQKLFQTATETAVEPAKTTRSREKNVLKALCSKNADRADAIRPGRFPMLSLHDDLDFDECELSGERTYVDGSDSFCAISILELSKDPTVDDLNRLLDE